MRTGSGWPSVFLPPLLLIPLAFLPLGLGTGLLWVAAGVACLLSAWTVLAFAVRWARGGARPRMALWRPALTLLLFVAVTRIVGASLVSADELGRDLASEADRRCKANGVCPRVMAEYGCTPPPAAGPPSGGCVLEHSAYGTTHRIRYRPSPDGHTFMVSVRHGFDSALIISGGVERVLAERLHSG